MRIRYKKWARPELEASKFYIDKPEEIKGKWKEQFGWIWWKMNHIIFGFETERGAGRIARTLSILFAPLIPFEIIIPPIFLIRLPSL